jgi:hypothetical protein
MCSTSNFPRNSEWAANCDDLCEGHGCAPHLSAHRAFDIAGAHVPAPDYHLDFIQQDAMRLCSKLNRNIAQFHAFLGEQ